MLKQTIAGISFENPIIAASGCFGFGLEYKDLFDPNLLGAITLKTITLEPVLPLPSPRMAEVSSGILHKIGWENPGIETFSKMTRLAIEKNLTNPIIVSIGGSNASEYATLATRLKEFPFIKALELDLSSLFTPAQSFSDEEILSIVRETRKATALPLFGKLSLPHIRGALLKGLEKEGITGFSLINSPAGMKVHTKRRSCFFGKGMGGALSGPVIKPLALQALFEARKHTSLPIIAMGGIVNEEDMLEFFLLGANLVAIGSGFFKNPLCVPESLERLVQYLENNKLSFSELIGKAL